MSQFRLEYLFLWRRVMYGYGDWLRFRVCSVRWVLGYCLRVGVKAMGGDQRVGVGMNWRMTFASWSSPSSSVRRSSTGLSRQAIFSFMTELCNLSSSIMFLCCTSFCHKQGATRTICRP